MSQTYDAFIVVKDNSKRMKLQLSAMILFMISIVINMIYSNYYILVLFAPFLILLNRYRILKQYQNHYLDCTLTTVLLKDSIRLIINNVPKEYTFDSLLSYSNIQRVDFYDDGHVRIVCRNILNQNDNYVKKKTLYLKFDDESLKEFKKSMTELLEQFK